MFNNDKIKDLIKVNPTALKELATQGFDQMLVSQQTLAIELVARLRRVHPEKTPAELIKFLNKSYVSAVAASGTGTGMASVIPNGVVQVPATLAELSLFLEASVLYVLALAEIHGVNTEDYERRKFLVTTALLGNSGAQTVIQALGKKTVPHWSQTIINRIPSEAIKRANKILGPRFITKYGTKQGILVLGKQIPLALGAVVGAAGNSIFAYSVIKATGKLLQVPPTSWTDDDKSLSGDK